MSELWYVLWGYFEKKWENDAAVGDSAERTTRCWVLVTHGGSSRFTDGWFVSEVAGHRAPSPSPELELWLEGGRAGSGSSLWLLTPVSWTYRGITVTASREEWGHCELCRCDVCICCPTSLLYSGRHYVQQEISVGFHARPVYVRSRTLSLFQFLCCMSKSIWTYYFW